jgi:uncharacterized membrane protein YozB (DUF420 family)
VTIQDLPALNASLNAFATFFLVTGFVAIRRGKRELHQKLMVMALIMSAFFLTSYLVYHFNTAAVTKYQGEGWLRTAYFIVLFSHIPLATLMVPFIFWAVIAAYRGNFFRHRQLVRWVWPVWLYVSVTGVIIYLMLYT